MEAALPLVEPGDVLVAENAGPRWTPLFPILGALVLDDGVLTQHAATTAREYGLPAVIRTMCATSRIVDGDWVVVDGTAGTVEVDA
jgi:pyruvate,water dikinase